MPDGTTKTEKQVAHIHRDATVDEVTGDVTYDPWSTDATDWTAYTAPVVAGYTPDKSVEAATVDENTRDTTVDINYTANGQTMNINYVDDNNKVVDGGHFVVSGNTGQTVNTNAKIPAGWVLKEGATDAPATITFTGAHTADITVHVIHGTRHVDHKTPDTPGTKTPTGKDVTGTQNSDLNQTITRTIVLHEPGKEAQTITQTAKIYRDATVDEVTGDVTYTDWSTDAWAKYDVPTVSGYTPSQSKVEAVTVKDGQKDVNIFRDATVDNVTGDVTYGDWSTASWDDFKPATIDGYTASQTDVAQTPVTSETKPVTVNITYTANNQTGKIVYVDVDNKNTEVGHTDLNGKTDATVAINPKAPAGFDIVPEQNIPKSKKATAVGIPTVTVKVSHHKITVNPGDEPKPGDKKPSNPNKKPGDGTPNTDVSYETLHRDMTRTINVTDPHTGLHTTKVTIHYERVATIDDVTGEVTYGAWTVVEGSKAGFDDFAIPKVDGYTSRIKSGYAENLKKLTPTQDQVTNWKDQTVDIVYDPIDPGDDHEPDHNTDSGKPVEDKQPEDKPGDHGNNPSDSNPGNKDHDQDNKQTQTSDHNQELGQPNKKQTDKQAATHDDQSTIRQSDSVTPAQRKHAASLTRAVRANAKLQSGDQLPQTGSRASQQAGLGLALLAVADMLALLGVRPKKKQ